MRSAESEETLSVCSEDSQATFPYVDNSDETSYRIHWLPTNPTASQSEDSVVELDVPELYSHRFIPDSDPAPLSTSFVEEYEEVAGEERDEGDEQAGPREEGEEERGGPSEQWNRQVSNTYSNFDFLLFV